MALVHHELCFGCGRTNLFGLLLELEEPAPGAVAGRCFIKQDHQGADPGNAHEGIVIAALSEAMAFACGESARVRELSVSLTGRRRWESFWRSRPSSMGDVSGEAQASATATAEGQLVASASGKYADA